VAVLSSWTIMMRWWKAVLTYPPTWVAMGAVVVAVVATLALLEPPALLAAAAVLLGVVFVMIWPVVLSATGTLNRLRFATPRLPDISETELRLLGDRLERLDDPRPAYQLGAIQEKRDNLVAVLDRRLQTGELTYARYQSTAQQVYLAVVSNLREVDVAMGSVSTIDPEYIDARLAKLQHERDESTQAEIGSLQDRRALATTQQAKVTYLLAQNESAMTLLDRTSTALADTPIGVAPQDAEAAIEALKELADRAGKYATA
jgi:hypothetical protein